MRLLSTFVLVLACSGCAVTPTPTPAMPPSDMAADRFLSAIAAHCGKAYVGRIVANQPVPTTPDAFDGKMLVMHVRGCDQPAQRIEIPFHVGEDRSRTWLLTRTAGGLRLKHDHRHADGKPDAVTMYGGDTAELGSPTRQVFPVDAESIAMFRREGLGASVANTWAMEIQPAMFAYELTRPNGRRFRVEFDLSRPVATPPKPWGW